jgi:hypothetical protein
MSTSTKAMPRVANQCATSTRKVRHPATLTSSSEFAGVVGRRAGFAVDGRRQQHDIEQCAATKRKQVAFPSL